MSDSRICTDATLPLLRKQRGYLCLPGCVDYGTALRWQQKLMAARRDRPDLLDVLFLLEHPPVYTLGQGASSAYLNFTPEAAPFPIHRIERGGEVTYHGPGQLVGYPILNLRRYRMDLHWYLRQLEEVIIQTLATYGLAADRVPGLTGVWLEGHKLAAIGIKVSRWITMHGFALNVCPDLDPFSAIVPCGIADKPIGSLAQFLPGITIADVQPRLITAFAQVFGIDWQIISWTELAAPDLAGLSGEF
ncbi:lipoyl(octanoyl) transferase LipB [Trichothermofontia sp.]